MKIYFAGSIAGGRDDARTYGALIEFLKGHGVRVTNLWNRGIRLVMHRHIEDADIDRAVASMRAATEEKLFG